MRSFSMLLQGSNLCPQSCESKGFTTCPILVYSKGSLAQVLIGYVSQLVSYSVDN